MRSVFPKKHELAHLASRAESQGRPPVPGTRAHVELTRAATVVTGEEPLLPPDDDVEGPGLAAVRVTRELQIDTLLARAREGSRSVGKQDDSGENLLPGATLTGVDLAGANLVGAVLTDATMTGANLTGTNLAGADHGSTKGRFLSTQ